MAPNDSRHNFPVNTMLFDSQMPLRTPRLTTNQAPTLANLKDAQDTTITALPQIVTEKVSTTVKKSTWRRMLDKIKKAFRCKKTSGIEEPGEDQHLETSRSELLRNTPPRTATVTGAKMDAEGTAVEEGGDSDWEDMEETRIFRIQ